jgi:hypothetical protein
MLSAPEKQYLHLPGIDTLHLCINSQINCGVSSNTPASVVAAAESAGLQNINRIDYKTRDRPDLSAMANEWIDKVFETLTRVFLRKRRDVAAAADSDAWRSDEDIEHEVKRRIQDIRDAHDKGFVIPANVGMVVAQKP